MALEQQDNLITDKANESLSRREKTQNLITQFDTVPRDGGSMKVSFYYIPHMSSLVEVQRIRKALLPFAEILVEHSIDLDTRHLTLYHHCGIDEVTIALIRLSLGAELQQTLSHYEPLEMNTLNTDTATLQEHKNESQDSYLSVLGRFLISCFNHLKQWIKCLQGKKDN